MQESFVEAYYSASDQYDEPEERRGDSSRSATAHRVAGAAVKNKDGKDENTGKWKEKQALSSTV